MTCATPLIELVTDENANIVDLLGRGTEAKSE